MHKLKIIFSLSFIVLIGSCGGKSDVASPEGYITLNMSPLTVIGFSDDGRFSPLHPIVDMGNLPEGKTVLLRVRDPHSAGDFYSINILNGFGITSNGTPAASDGEPDNTPANATALTFGVLSHHGLDPVLDEDWFSFTASAGECCHMASTVSNSSGSNADPILEVYDPTPNLGPTTYTQNITNQIDAVIVTSTFDPTTSLTLIGMTRFNSFDDLDKNSFYLVFSGPPAEGNYPVITAWPPVPKDSPGSVTGSVQIGQYDDVGGRIQGDFSLTITDESRTSTVEGSFDVERNSNEAGLLSGLHPAAARSISVEKNTLLKTISSYLTKHTKNTNP